MLYGMREILIISTERDTPLIEKLLGDGSKWGLSLSYQVQKKPDGIAQAYVLGADFVRGQHSCLILGDNFFYGLIPRDLLNRLEKKPKGASILAYRVQNPENFGVVELNGQAQPVSLVEKPKSFVSHWAVPGLYFYDETAPEKVKSLKPSPRGELEITDLNKMYLSEGTLHVERLGRGVAWLDMGNPDNLLSSSTFVQVIEQRQGLKIACIEEIAVAMGYIGLRDLDRLISEYPPSEYRKYLERLAQEFEFHFVSPTVRLDNGKNK